MLKKTHFRFLLPLAFFFFISPSRSLLWKDIYSNINMGSYLAHTHHIWLHFWHWQVCCGGIWVFELRFLWSCPPVLLCLSTNFKPLQTYSSFCKKQNWWKCVKNFKLKGGEWGCIYKYQYEDRIMYPGYSYICVYAQ